MDSEWSRLNKPRVFNGVFLTSLQFLENHTFGLSLKAFLCSSRDFGSTFTHVLLLL